MRIPLAAVLVLLAGTLSVRGAEPEDWPAARAELGRIVAAIRTDPAACPRIWHVAWPWAKRGEAEARGILAAGMFVFGLRPPGAGDALSLMRHNVILTLYGALGAKPLPEGADKPDGDAGSVAMGHLAGLLQSPFLLGLGGERLKACLDGGAPARTCVEQAVADGFVPSFEDYAAEVDALAGLKPARCTSASQPESSAPDR